MQTALADFIKDTPEGKEAEGILRNCVHCGFCLATCPTYQLLGDELDGPRGRIYLMKQVLEGQPVTGKTQLHLDRCLTCRACETTCPSGVHYSRLLEIGREVVDSRVARPPGESMARIALRKVVTRPALFRSLVKIGQLTRPWLPEKLRRKVPPTARRAKPMPSTLHARRMLVLEGCVQPALSPATNAAGRARARPARHLRWSQHRGPDAVAPCRCISTRAKKRSISCGGTSTPGGRTSNRASRRSSSLPAAAASW